MNQVHKELLDHLDYLDQEEKLDYLDLMDQQAQPVPLAREEKQDLQEPPDLLVLLVLPDHVVKLDPLEQRDLKENKVIEEHLVEMVLLVLKEREVKQDL